MTDIYYAAATGDIKLLKELIAAGGVDLNARGSFDERRIDPRDSPKKDLTPLGLAAKYGHAEMVSFLLDQGVHVDDNMADNNDKATPLGLAIQNQYPWDYVWDYDTWVEPPLKPSNPDNAALGYPKSARPTHGIPKKNMLEVGNILLKRGAKANTKVITPCLDTLLILAVQKSDVELIKLLQEYSADPRISNKNGDTPLHKVTNVEITTMLLKWGVDVNARNNYNETPLHTACEERKSEVAIELIKHPSTDVNLGKDYMETPLMTGLMASPPLDIMVVQAFLDHPKIDLNVQDEGGDTALHYSKNAAIARMLCEKGAKVNIPNEEGFTPVEYQLRQMADHRWDPELIKVHIEFGNKADLMRWERNFPASAKPILAISGKVTKLLQEPVVNEIIAASQDPDTGELFRKNFMVRAKEGELDIVQYLHQRSLNPDIQDKFISSIGRDLVEKVAQVIIDNSSQRIPIPLEHQQEIANLVVENLHQNGVPSESIPGYIKNMSTNFSFLAQSLENFKNQVFEDGLMVRYNLFNLLNDDEQKSFSKDEKEKLTFEYYYGESSKEFMKPEQKALTVEQIKNIKKDLETYKEDSSLFLIPIVEILDILIGDLKKRKRELENSQVGIIEDIPNQDLRYDIKELRANVIPGEKLFKYLGTNSQVKELQERIREINDLGDKVEKYEKYEKYFDIVNKPISEEIKALQSSLKRHITTEDLLKVNTPRVNVPARGRSNTL